ncbi:MAG TPA: HAD family phosphatase [Trebonia sp.]
MASRGLLLDFGGVLTSSLYGRMAEFCVAAGLPADAIATALGTPEGLIVAALAEAGLAPQRDFEVMLARQLGLPSEGLIARLLALDAFTPRPETADLARRARAAGIPTGLLSNSWGDGGYDVYTGHDLAALFDVVVISHLVGLRKPERPIFELAAAKLGVTAADCVLVDDTWANVAAARELGMTGVHYTGEPEQLTEVERLLGLTSSGSLESLPGGAGG